MVGGTIFHRDVIQREISRALVLNLSGKTRCSGTAEWTESMVGGTIFHRDVIQREISRALVLNLSGKTRCSGTAEEIFVLDNAFALIEGQPPIGSGHVSAP